MSFADFGAQVVARRLCRTLGLPWASVDVIAGSEIWAAPRACAEQALRLVVDQSAACPTPRHLTAEAP